VGILATIFGITYCDVRLNRWYSNFYNLVGIAPPAEYFRAIAEYALVLSVWTAVARFGGYLRYRLRIHWREFMTQYFLNLWLQNHTHYALSLGAGHIDNPDQRIADDVIYFVDKTTRITFDLFENFLKLISFMGVLWGLSGSFSFQIFSGKTISIPGYLVWCNSTT
jgi:putative ATP-binding cassette transporter